LSPSDVRFLRLKCTKFDFGWGSAQNPLRGGGAYSAPPEPVVAFKGDAFKGQGEGKERQDRAQEERAGAVKERGTR